jgi:hypothetical protein
MSNSGMATHMRAKHRDLANQVVHFNMDEAFIEITTSRCRLHWIWQVDKKDETVRGTLPLFKLRSKADREKWQKLVNHKIGIFYAKHI